MLPDKISLPWHRRVGRRAFRGFRPLVAPLLHRLQARLGRAVEDATVTASVRDVEERLGRVEAHLGSMGTDLAGMIGLLERVEARLGPAGMNLAEVAALVLNHQAATDARLERVEHCLGAGGPGLAELVVALLQRQADVEGRLEHLDRQLGTSLPVRFDTLRIGLDAVRLDSRATEQAILGRLDGARAELETGRDALRTGLLAIEATQGEAADASREGRAELRGLAARTDLLLQRAAIPLGDDVLVRTPEGFLLAPAEDPALLAALHESGGRLEPGTVAVIRALLREGDLAIDVGAHIGLTVLPTARRVGPGGHVVAVEAGRRVGDLLRRNLALNGLSERVALHLCAAGEAAGSARLNVGAIFGHSSLLPLPGAERAEEVEVRTVDSMVEPGRPVRLAKLDAEGFEPQVWRGLTRVLAENPGMAVLVEFGPEHLRRAGISVPDWLALFLSPGFTAYEVDEATGRLNPLRPPAELEAVLSLNLLLLRQPPEAFPELDFA